MWDRYSYTNCTNKNFKTRETQELAQGHLAGKWQIQNLNADLSDSKASISSQQTTIIQCLIIFNVHHFESLGLLFQITISPMSETGQTLISQLGRRGHGDLGG